MAHLQTKGYFLRSLLDKRRIGENCKSRGGLLRELADGQEDRNEGAEEADGADGPFDHGAHVLVHPVEAVVESVETVVEFGRHAVETVVDLAAEFAEVRFQFGDIMFEDIQARENLAPAVEGFFFEQEQELIQRFFAKGFPQFGRCGGHTASIAGYLWGCKRNEGVETHDT